MVEKYQLNNGMNTKRRIDPIRKLKKEKVVDKDVITKEAFNEIINEVYSIMIDYTRLRKKYLTKNSPILIGNVEFWFNVTEDGQQQIKYNRPPPAWNEGLIREDLNLHFHGLHFNP